MSFFTPESEECSLRKGIKIAICGKGGVGKTTICAILAQLFAEDGANVIAIDADCDTNLCSAFGVAAKQSPEPLINMKQLIAERTGSSKDAPGAYFTLNPNVSDLPDKYFLKIDSVKSETTNTPPASAVKLLVLGAVKQAGGGCACSEAAFLRALLRHTILGRDEVILVDLGAGIEFMGRASVEGVDSLLIVIEPGSRSVETALNISRMAKKLGIKHIAGIINKVRSADEVEAINNQLEDLTVIAAVDYSSNVQQADFARSSVYQSDEQTVNKLRQAKESLVKLAV